MRQCYYLRANLLIQKYKFITQLKTLLDISKRVFFYSFYPVRQNVSKSKNNFKRKTNILKFKNYEHIKTFPKDIEVLKEV